MTRQATHTQIESDAEKLRQSTSQLAKDMQRVGSALKTLAEDSYEEVQHKLSSLYEESKGRYSEAENKLESKIKADPIKAVLIAAGVGFVLAWLRKK